MRLPLDAALASVAAGAAVVALGIVVYKRFRRPKDPEAFRRRLLETEGRIVEGVVFDYRDGVVFYGWSWQGVQYESSQDITAVLHLLPAEPDLLMGPAAVRFLPRDPSNSIVIAENWNGFRLDTSKV